jgi:hypothetical protein
VCCRRVLSAGAVGGHVNSNHASGCIAVFSRKLSRGAVPWSTSAKAAKAAAGVNTAMSEANSMLSHSSATPKPAYYPPPTSKRYPA